MDLDLVAGSFVSWAALKGRRSADDASNEDLRRLGELVESELGSDPAVRTVIDAPATPGGASRVRDSLAEAVQVDPDFARELAAAAERLAQPGKGVFRIAASDGAFPRYRIDVAPPPAEEPVQLREGFGFYPVRRKAELDELCRRHRAVILVSGRAEKGQGEINALSTIRRRAWPQISEMCAERNLGMAWVNLGSYLANLVSGGQEETVHEWLRINGYCRSSILVLVGGEVVRSRVLRFWADSDVLAPTRWTADETPFRTAVEEILDGLL